MRTISLRVQTFRWSALFIISELPLRQQTGRTRPAPSLYFPEARNQTLWFKVSGLRHCKLSHRDGSVLCAKSRLGFTRAEIFCMQITDKQIERFIHIYQRHFGVLLKREIAYEKCLQLVNLVKAIYKPIKKTDYEEYSKKI